MYLAAQGLKSTAQREVIARVFFASEGHLSLNQLLERAKGERDSVGYATVYRTMKLLAESGLASQHDFGGGETRFEPAVEGSSRVTKMSLCATGTPISGPAPP